MPNFRIKDESTTNKTLRFPNTLLARAMKVANDNNISFNKLVIQSLEFALDNLKTESKLKPKRTPKEK